MKFCSRCGAQLEDTAKFCSSCGKPVDAPAYQQPMAQFRPAGKAEPNGLQMAAYVLMILTTIAGGFLLLPLAWLLPMTLHYKKCIYSGVPVTVGFKVCTLIFVNLIPGILMLCDDKG